MLHAVAAAHRSTYLNEGQWQWKGALTVKVALTYHTTPNGDDVLMIDDGQKGAESS
jgi:hypothetical protein